MRGRRAPRQGVGGVYFPLPPQASPAPCRRARPEIYVALLFFACAPPPGEISSIRLDAPPALVSASITRHGEVILREVGEKATSLDESMRRLAFVQGAMHWWLDPLVPMLSLTLNSTHPSSALRIEALDAFLASTDPRYQPQIAASLPLPNRIVANDGTMPALGQLPAHYEPIVASLLRFGVREDALVSKQKLDDESLAIAEAWLAGAQSMAKGHAREFYEANPELRATGLIEHFAQMSVDDLLESYASASMLYDVGGIQGTVSAFVGLGWTSGLETLPHAAQRKVEAIGASNGWAFTYSPAENPSKKNFIVAGEPHQPSSPREQNKMFISYFTDDNGDTQPMVGAVPSGLPAISLLSFSRNHGLSGTAGPSAGSLMFFAETNKDHTKYLASDGVWRDFPTRDLVVPRNGQPHVISVRQIGEGTDYFGDVFLYVTRPGTETHYAVAMRRRDTTDFYNTIVSLVRAGVSGDEDKFTGAIRAGLPHFEVAGAYRTASGVPKTFLALFQGHQDIIADETTVSPFTPNSPQPGFRKLGQYATPHCANMTTVAANNGSLLGGGCLSDPARPHRLDPGYPTPRQQMVRDFAESHQTESVPLARDDLYRFATGTQSYFNRHIAEAMVLSVVRYGELYIPTVELALANAVAASLVGTDGATDDGPLPIFFLHVANAITPLLYNPASGINETTRRYFREPGVTLAQVSEQLDDATAQALIAIFRQAVSFFLSECVPAGVTSWKQITSFIHDGEVVASGIAGPGMSESMNTAGYAFVKRPDGSLTCRVESYSSSPFKFVQLGDDEICYLPFGGTVNNLSLERGLAAKAKAAWKERWSRMNPGTGYDSEHAYRCISLAKDAPTDELLSEVVANYTFRVPDRADVWRLLGK